MTSRFVRWLSIVALLVGLVAGSSELYRIALGLVVCGAALVVFGQAFRTGNYIWGTGFLTIAVLFNPFVPMALSGRWFFGLELACAAMFAISLVALRAEPRLSISGIIKPLRRIESL